MWLATSCALLGLLGDASLSDRPAAVGQLSNFLLSRQNEDQGNQHMGAWLEVNGQECAIEIMGQRQSFALSPTVKISGPKGEPLKVVDIKAGQSVRVTCKKNEPALVVQIDVLTP